MVIHHLHVIGIAPLPAEAEPPLVVDPDAPFSGTVAGQLLETVAGRDPEIVEANGGIEEAEFAEPGALHLGPPAADRHPLEEAFGVAVSEAPDHRPIVTYGVMACKGAGRSALTTCA